MNIYDAKAHFSQLLRRVRMGEQIVIADAGTPVARLVPLTPATGRRVLGGDEGAVWIADDFDAPLPPEILDEFYGPDAPKASDRSRAAKPSAPRAKRRR